MITLRIVTYARVSTAEQVAMGTSLEDQRTRLRAAVLARAGEHIGHFEDAGVSGSLARRPGLDALRQEVLQGGVDLAIATKIDRVSRSALGLLNLVEELRGHGCHLVLIDEGLDTSTPAGDLTSGVLGVIGGWERRRIAERTKQGRINVAGEGRFVASTPPFGYQVVSAPDGRGKRLAVQEEAARTIRPGSASRRRGVIAKRCLLGWNDGDYDISYRSSERHLFGGNDTWGQGGAKGSGSGASGGRW